MGKGSKQRPTNHDAYASNYDAIFGKRRQEVPTIDPEVEDSWSDSADAMSALNDAIEQELE